MFLGPSPSFHFFLNTYTHIANQTPQFSLLFLDFPIPSEESPVSFFHCQLSTKSLSLSTLARQSKRKKKLHPVPHPLLLLNYPKPTKTLYPPAHPVQIPKINLLLLLQTLLSHAYIHLVILLLQTLRPYIHSFCKFYAHTFTCFSIHLNFLRRLLILHPSPHNCRSNDRQQNCH